jgi:Putative rRNA methylase
MYARYNLFHSHIDLSHTHWKVLIKPGDTVVDATCGNGHDTLVLAKLALTEKSGTLFAIDLQPEAIESCRQMLINKIPKNHFNRILFCEGCHSKFPSEIHTHSVKLIAYNLGYLPGGDKNKTTKAETTLQSVVQGMDLIQDGGLISLTCYPGHKAGIEEEEGILQFASKLDPKMWSCCHHRWLNRRNAPSLLLMQKRITNPRSSQPDSM